jgi:hypothetical protein
VAADDAGIAAAGEPKQVLLADSSKGALLIDKDAPRPQARKRKSEDECPVASGKQIQPAAPNDLHASASRTDC